jgi:hypothetical protein
MHRRESAMRRRVPPKPLMRYRFGVGVSGMDHPITGADRFEAARRAAHVPPVTVGVRSVAERLDRHLAILVSDPQSDSRAVQSDTAAQAVQAVQLLREISPRTASSQPKRRFSLFAPLRSFKRWFGM